MQNLQEIKDYLDNYILFELNDKITRKLITENCKVICTENENTPEVIDKNELRFIYKNLLYRYYMGRNDTVIELIG